MKKSCLLVLSLVFASGMLFAQHGRGGGRGNAGNPGQEMGQGHSMDVPQAGRPDKTGKPEMQGKHETAKSTEQHALKQSQINSGAFRMLERKYSGMTSAQLQDLYKSSGAKNFGQFVSAMVVSKNLNLDYNKVLAGLKTDSLGKTLQSLGVGKEQAKQAMEQAEKELRTADRERKNNRKDMEPTRG